MWRPSTERGATRRRRAVIGGLFVALIAPIMSIASTTPTIAAPEDPVVVYDTIGNLSLKNVPSQPFQATQTHEFGDLVRLAPGPRALTSITVMMSSWACENGSWTNNCTTTTPGSGFQHPLTINVYAVTGPDSAPVVNAASPLVTLTQTATIPFRPTTSGTCTGIETGYWFDATANNGAGKCYGGVAAPVTFTFPGTTVLPSRVVWTIAFNTTSAGKNPIGTGPACFSTDTCPYDSLNVGALTQPSLTVIGTDVDEASAFLSAHVGPNVYCDNGAAGLDVLRHDSGCWGGFRPLAKIVAKPLAASASTTVVNAANLNGWQFVNDSTDAVVPPTLSAGIEGQPLGTGSAEITAAAGGRKMLGTAAFAGTPISRLTALNYTFYQSPLQAAAAPDGNPAVSLTLQFDVKYRPADTKYGGRLVYEPSNGNGNAVAGWQTRQALTGKWWASTTVISATRDGSDGKCGQGSPCTWSQILDLFPDATIGGRVLVRGGSPGLPEFTGFVDSVDVGIDNGAGTVNTTTFDFENTLATPTLVAVPGNTIGGENDTTSSWAYDHQEPKVPGSESVVADAAPVAAAAGSASLIDGSVKLTTVGKSDTTLSEQARVIHLVTGATLAQLLEGRPTYTIFVPDSASLNAQGNLQFGFQCGGWTGAVILSPTDNPGTKDIANALPGVGAWQTYRYPSATDVNARLFVATDGGTAPAGFAGFTRVSVVRLLETCGSASVLNARFSMGRNTTPLATSYLDNATFLGTTYNFVAVQSPVITSGAPVSGTVGTPYSFTFTATGPPAPTFSVAAGTLPSGLTLTSAGVLSGTPTAAGSFSFLLRASNGVAPAADQFVTVTVAAIPTAAPAIISGTPQAGTVGTAYSFGFSATGSPVPTFAVNGGTLPAGLTLSSAGLLSGTPTAAGTFNFVVRASNGVLPAADQFVTLTIIQVASLGPVLAAATPVAVTPTRALDTRTSTIPASGSTTSVKVTGVAGVPTDAQAVFLNVTATEATAAGYVTVFASDKAQPATSNLNIEAAGETVPNMVVSSIGADGEVKLFVQKSTHLIVDVMGYIPAGVGYSPVTPTRVLDTRTTTRPGNGATTTVKVTDIAGVPAGATSVILNVTDVNTAGPGYVTVWPTGGVQPTTSNLNVDHAGQTRPGLVIVPIGTDGKVSLFQQTSADLVVDVFGFFTAAANYNAIQQPERLLDTRVPTIGYSGGKPAAEATVSVKVAGVGSVPADVKYVVVNVTGDKATAPGYVTVFPGKTAVPKASNLNLGAVDATASNLAFVPVGADGTVSLYTLGGTHLVLDVFGWVK